VQLDNPLDKLAPPKSKIFQQLLGNETEPMI
jgi:hypothetical protein